MPAKEPIPLLTKEEMEAGAKMDFGELFRSRFKEEQAGIITGLLDKAVKKQDTDALKKAMDLMERFAEEDQKEDKFLLTNEQFNRVVLAYAKRLEDRMARINTISAAESAMADTEPDAPQDVADRLAGVLSGSGS